MYHVYVLKSLKNEKHYIGMTSKKVDQRLDEHNRGTTYWTKRNGPFRVIYHEGYSDKTFAQKRERFLKSGNGRKFLKQKLAEQY